MIFVDCKYYGNKTLQSWFNFLYQWTTTNLLHQKKLRSVLEKNIEL